MSVEIIGNNSIDDIPLADMTVEPWAGIVDRCDPLLIQLAHVGLSAVCHGINQSPDPQQGIEAATSQNLFDDSGRFVNEALRNILLRGISQGEPYGDLLVAGTHIARAAVVASRMLRELPVIDDDYVGKTGVSIVQRRVTLPLEPGTVGAAGRTMRNVQARIFVQGDEATHSHAELTFAASLYGGGALPRSMSTFLGGTVDSHRGLVRARLTSALRQGDFAVSSQQADFRELDVYADVVTDNLSAAR